MSQFLGTHENKLDAKGRVSFPSSYRTALRGLGEAGTGSVILRPSHRFACIEAWPASTFQTLAAPLDALDVFSDAHDDLAASLYADAYAVEPDGDGRVILANPLIQHAGISSRVVFMGLGRYFQIWEPAAAAQRVAAAREAARSRGFTLPGSGAPGSTTSGAGRS